MIEKLKPNKDKVFKTETGECLTIPELWVPKPVSDKINELVDAVNTIQKEREAERFEIQEWIGILEAVRKSVNVHEKQIDELQMKVEPEKCEIPADNSEKANCQENVQDMFAEQRKWIGCVCRFWDIDNDYLYYGPLTKISDMGPYYYECNHRICYAHCEPVKDDVIYKGGDND